MALPHLLLLLVAAAAPALAALRGVVLLVLLLVGQRAEKSVAERAMERVEVLEAEHRGDLGHVPPPTVAARPARSASRPSASSACAGSSTVISPSPLRSKRSNTRRSRTAFRLPLRSRNDADGVPFASTGLTATATPCWWFVSAMAGPWCYTATRI
jgi:hypothetical protein